MIEILLAVLALWIIVLYVAKKRGDKKGFSVAGPLIMWKTKRGMETIDRVAKKPFWKHYGTFSIILYAVVMVFTTALIILNAVVSFKIAPQNVPSPRLYLGLPGINPVIPIGYGIVAIVVALAAHELAHGILTRAGNLKLKSLGLMFLIAPIGAFAEPDTEELNQTTRLTRSRIYAVGPSTNIIFAVVCLLLLTFVMSPAIKPVNDGVIIGTDAFGVNAWSVIDKIGNRTVVNTDDIEQILSTFEPGQFYELSVLKSHERFITSFLFGISIQSVVKDSPASGSLEKHAIIYKLTYQSNEYLLSNSSDFTEVMNSTTAKIPLTIYYFMDGSFRNTTVILADKYEFTDDKDDIGHGFLGVGAFGLSDVTLNTDYVPTIYSPFKGNFLAYLALPFLGLSPLPNELAELYTPSPIFWIVYNTIYWVFWLSFAFGTFNALPATPLDGGYIFKDGIGYLLSRFGGKTKERAERLSSFVTIAVSLIILFCIISVILVPRLKTLI